MLPKKIFVYSYACELRLLDGMKIYRYLSKNKHKLVKSPRDADIILFVTCAVHNQTAENVINKIKEFQKYDAELIVAGCLPEIEKEKLAEIFDGRTISTKNIDQIDNLFPENKIKFDNINDENVINYSKVMVEYGIYSKFMNYLLKRFFYKYDDDSFLYNFSKKDPLYYIKASWGCNGNCSYCAIKKAIGPLKSKPIDECVKELKKGLNKGYTNFILAADDIGAYGLGIGSNLPNLLIELTEIPEDYKISIREIGPGWVVKYINELEDIVKKHKIANMGITLQSYSSRILKRMNRYSDVDRIKDAFLRLKKSDSNLNFNTHIIIGFPTETEEEFKQTLYLIKEIDFDSGLVFPFSCKDGTEAEEIEPKISLEEIDKRLIYAKKFLKNSGYKVYNSNQNYFMFRKNIREF